VRRLLPAGLAAALLALLAGTALAKRPVVAPGTNLPPPPPMAPKPAEEKPAEAAPEPEGKRPVTPAGTPATPPPPAPPPPADFAGAAPTPVAAPAAPKKDDPDPPELRWNKKTGDFSFALSSRPGKPRPGDPVELVVGIEEHLAIPDPVVGDTRPLVKQKLKATVEWPGGSRTYELHAMKDAGRYGFHFTSDVEGVHTIVVDRVNEKPGLRTEFPLGIGVPTPVPAGDDADPDARKGARGGRRPVGVGGAPPPRAPTAPVAGAAPRADDVTIAGVMEQLGKDVKLLSRKLGTPAATPIADRVEAHAKKLEGRVPEGHADARPLFEKLARQLLEESRAIKAVAGDKAKAEPMLRKLQDDVCLRCHAEFRFEIAESVERWPGFTKKASFTPPSSAPAKGKAAPKGKKGGRP